MVREALLFIRQLPAVLALVVRFPFIDSLKSVAAQSFANTSMLLPNDTGESVDYDFISVLDRNETLLFDVTNSNASLLFPRNLMDSVGIMHDDPSPHVTRVHVPVGYLIGLSIGVCALMFSLVGIALLQRRKAKIIVLLPDHSIFASPAEHKAWDSLSFSYGGGESDVAKNSWESIEDDSYLASLDEVIAQRASVIAFQKRASAVVVPHPIGEAPATTATTAAATTTAATATVT